MDRRTYLGGLGTGGFAGVAGCLGSIESALGGEEPGRGNWGDGQTVLDTPTEDRGDPVHPIYGQEMPSFSFPDPLTGETVSSNDLEGEKAYLMTFFYTSCPDGACPALLLRLRRAQADAVENDYVDDLDLLAITFDPERDTPEVLEEYAGQQGADLEVGNWHFLRPEDNETAHATLNDKFGMKLERVEDHEAAGHGDDDGDDDGDGEDHANDSQSDDDSESDGHENDTDGHDHDDYAFTHINLIFLVNEHGIVERSYPRGTTVDTSKVLEDVRTVVGH